MLFLELQMVKSVEEKLETKTNSNLSIRLKLETATFLCEWLFFCSLLFRFIFFLNLWFCYIFFIES
jgi:hypothetical protein